MTSILVVGSVALDTVETPFGKAESVLGGSAAFFSVAAGYFASARMVAPVGHDLPEEHCDLLRKHKVDLAGLCRLEGLTPRWSGTYGFDLKQSATVDAQPHVLTAYRPEISPEWQTPEYVFLADLSPEQQLAALEQVERPTVVACETASRFIENDRQGLVEVFSSVDIAFLNEAELRAFTDEPNLVRAAKKLLSLGPRFVAVKRGEYGALLMGEGAIFAAPAYPLEEVVDPTGVGASFAGGFMGYLAHEGRFHAATLRKAVAFGNVLASFTVEDFSLRRLARLTHPDIQARMQNYKRMLELELSHV